MSKLMPFHQWLKQRRKALGLTQKDLAQQAGCAEITLRKIEAGDLQPSPQLAASLARAVGASDADLPGMTGFAPPGTTTHTPVEHWRMPRRPQNLSTQLTPLIGRTHDIAAVRKRLLSDDARLITLLGPPGVGKTRLAQAVAEDVLEQFEDGAFFVRLAPISDPTLVASAIAQALDLQLTGSNPPALQLRRYLEEKHLLLVLDNFEQVIEAAALVDDLLRRCQWLHVLVTSRQALRVRGERQVPVLPLALPAGVPGAASTTASEVLRYPAVALFEERAQAVQPDFAVSDVNAAPVAELCRRLDGLPLAIELVAARVKLLPPADLLARVHGPWMLSVDGLRDVSARQKTLRGAIGWSYDLLTPAEQTLFTRLAVFVGGCTLQAAELLCGADATLGPPLPLSLSPIQILDGIASLLDKSLLHRQAGIHGEPRYVMLETVREYGLERVAAGGEEETLRKRHACCLLKLIERAELSDPDPGHVVLLNLVDDEIFNVRAALTWTAQHDVQAALLLYTASLSWSGKRGSYANREGLIDEVLNLPAAAHTVPRVKALLATAARGGDLSTERRRVYAQEAMALSGEIGYPKGEADALFILGTIAHDAPVNDWNAARNYLEASLTCYRTLGDLSQSAHALAMLSEVALMIGDFSRARVLAEQSLAAAQKAGFNYAWPYGIMANLAWGEGDMDSARALYEQFLASARLRGINGTLVYALTDLGAFATRQGDFVAAHAFLDEALVYLEKLGDPEFTRACTWHLAALAQAEGDYVDALRLYRASLVGLQHVPGDWSRCLSHLATMAGALGRHELSARVLGAIALTEETGQSLYPIEREEINRLSEAAQAQLGEVRFDAAWAEGRTTSFETVVEAAVSALEEVLRVQDQVPPG